MPIQKIDFDKLAYDCSTHEVYVRDGESESRYNQGYSAPLLETMYNIVDNRIIDYASNKMFREPGLNFCDIGRYDDMPGQDEVKNVVSTIPKECWDEFLETNPNLRNSLAMTFVDENYKANTDIPKFEKKLCMITYASFDEDGHTVDSVEWLDDYDAYTPKEMAEQCANFLSQTNSAYVTPDNTVYQVYDGVNQKFAQYDYLSEDQFKQIQDVIHYRNQGTAHYEGSIGTFDYDKSQFKIFSGKSGDFLGYIGSEKDGSKIKIPDGIKDCHRMFWGREIDSAPKVPESVPAEERLAISAMLGKHNMERIRHINAESIKSMDRGKTVDADLGISDFSNADDFDFNK